MRVTLIGSVDRKRSLQLRGPAIAGITIAVLSIGLATPAQATQGVAKKYSSCSDLLKKYPNGVTKNKKARNAAVRDGFAKPKISKALYKTNGSRLDRDKDGVMCEQTGGQTSSVTAEGLARKLQLAGLGCEDFKARDYKMWGGTAGRCTALGEDISLETYGNGRLSEAAQFACDLGISGFAATDQKNWLVYSESRERATQFGEAVGGEIVDICEVF